MMSILISLIMIYLAIGLGTYLMAYVASENTMGVVESIMFPIVWPYMLLLLSNYIKRREKEAKDRS